MQAVAATILSSATHPVDPRIVSWPPSQDRNQAHVGCLPSLLSSATHPPSWSKLQSFRLFRKDCSCRFTFAVLAACLLFFACQAGDPRCWGPVCPWRCGSSSLPTTELFTCVLLAQSIMIISLSMYIVHTWSLRVRLNGTPQKMMIYPPAVKIYLPAFRGSPSTNAGVQVWQSQGVPVASDACSYWSISVPTKT